MPDPTPNDTTAPQPEVQLEEVGWPSVRRCEEAFRGISEPTYGRTRKRLG